MTKEQFFYAFVTVVGLVVAGGGAYVLSRGWFRDRAERKVKERDDD
jgi:hypothetical protein